MAAHRQDRLNRQIAAEVGEILRTVKDPRVSGALICVTGAEVSPRSVKRKNILRGFWAVRARLRRLPRALQAHRAISVRSSPPG